MEASTAQLALETGDLSWSDLSPRGRAILRRVAVPLANGFSRRELARELGCPPKTITALLAELRDPTSPSWQAPSVS